MIGGWTRYPRPTRVADRCEQGTDREGCRLYSVEERRRAVRAYTVVRYELGDSRALDLASRLSGASRASVRRWVLQAEREQAGDMDRESASGSAEEDARLLRACGDLVPLLVNRLLRGLGGSSDTESK